MTPERWKRIEEVYHSAHGRPASERAAFLVEACGDDEELRRDVESLLNEPASADGLLSKPALAMADQMFNDVPSASLVGRRLGGYQLQALVGAGGMGEVYRARDTKLGRDVAIKILPRAFTIDPDRLARFEREARMLAALNHPNICGIYGLEEADGIRFLILELVDGETLAERLALVSSALGRIPRASPEAARKRAEDGTAKRMSVSESLAIARQIAEALEAAHEKGIVHRDLKPANIKITPEGVVKVLDLGLAKATSTDASGIDLTHSPTVTIGGTRDGVILGTPAYMSPEQARGKGADKRADIWAFGCVLYEMLTVRAPFAGDTISDTLARILERDPDWGVLPATVPPNVTRLLQRCLEKDLRRRLHDIADARLEIEDALSGSASVAAAGGVILRPQPVRLLWAVASIASLVALISFGALTWNLRTAQQPQPVASRISRLTLGTSGEAAVALNDRSLAITPDGTRVVYIGDIRRQLFVRPLDRLEATAIYRASAPLNFVFVSPDGHWVGFVEGSSLKKMAITGGPAVTLAQSISAATWAPDETIIVADGDTATGLQRISASGGAVTLLTEPVKARGELDHTWPEMLPGGHAVLFTITAATGGLDAAQVAVLDLATGTSTVLVRGGSHAHYVHTAGGSQKRVDGEGGYLVYTAGGALRAIPFDLARLETRGPAVTVLPSLAVTSQGGGNFDIAADGTLAFVAAPPRANSTLVWVDRQGREQPLLAPPRRYYQPRVSPDGTRVAVAIAGPSNNIWVWDLLKRTLNRLTTGPIEDFFPVWTRDGSRLVFASFRGRGPVLFWQSADGAGVAEPLGGPDFGLPNGVTPDGGLLFSVGARDLMLMPFGGSAPFQTREFRAPRPVQPLIQTRFNERSGVVSRDGRWMAYESDSSGRFEVYVQPFPNVNAGQWLISTAGGSRPVWAPSSQELFYEAPNGALMAVQVDPHGATLNASSPAKILDRTAYLTSAGSSRDWDISPDGTRFLIVKLSPDGQAAPQIVVVQNWLEELKQLAPAEIK